MTRAAWDPAEVFEAHRGLLRAVAYRMVGSATDAEDLVQDTYLRWMRVDHRMIESPRKWLIRALTNLCMTFLSSARRRREEYVGPWLPEPLLTVGPEPGPDEVAEARDLVTIGTLFALERLTPSERAVFILHQAFGHTFSEIADLLDLTESNCRQLHHRARRHIREPERRNVADREHHQELLTRFLMAARNGDLDALERLLAEDVKYTADGGGHVGVARRPVAGRPAVKRLAVGMFASAADLRIGTTLQIPVFVESEVNTEPALLCLSGDLVVAALVVSPDTEGLRIANLYTLANPDKLGHLTSRWQAVARARTYR